VPFNNRKQLFEGISGYICGGKYESVFAKEERINMSYGG